MPTSTVPAFSVRSEDCEPAYLALYRSGELERRAQAALAGLETCVTCPRRCRVNRLAGATGTCRIGRYARVADYFPHHGEEDCLRGWRGSGTLFFAECALRCVFCQNFAISQNQCGEEARPERLAGIMLELQDAGCHNLNLVTPEHVVPQILEALPLAVARGLRLPLVYNTSGYDSLESLRLLDGVVDIYLPDFKLWDPQLALRYVRARDYPLVARAALREMHRQVGDLKLDERGLARRGVLVRHLVLPGGLAGTAQVMRFLARQVSPHAYVNIMAQYAPAGKVGLGRYDELNRPVTRDEVAQALAQARAAGLYRIESRA